MKKYLLVLLLFTSFMVKPVCALEKTEVNNGYVMEESKYSEFDNESERIIKRMEKTMQVLPITENIDYNFINEMIALHTEEIQLSTIIQGYTDNPEVLEYANDLLSAENGELREMRIIKKDLAKDMNKPTKGNEAYVKEFNSLLKGRFNNLYAYERYEDPAKNYLNIMNLNNEADIALANTYLKYSDNEVVKKVAENIINVKKEQISKAKELLAGIK